jgi:hypothetical protein
MRCKEYLFNVWSRSALAAVCGILLLTSSGFASSVSSLAIVGQGLVGSYTGNVAYDGNGLLTITLNNTTDPAYGGFITAFLFNVEGDCTARLIKDEAAGAFCDVIGGGVTLAKGAPFGDFEAGAGLASGKGKKSDLLGEFEGSGDPKDGIAPGASQTFQFTVSGSDVGSLSADSFLSQYSGQGSNSASFLVRIRGINDPDYPGVGSEKIPDDVIPPLVPLPQAAWSGLMLIGLIGVQGVRRQLRRVE